VLDARDGSVVAMASYPSYPVNQFTNGIPPAAFKIYSSPFSGDPLLNRATQGLYPPGSTFKMLTAVASLEHGEATPATSFDDNGCLVFGGQQFCNAGKEKLGIVNMPEAITVSSDLYFYNLGFKFWETFNKGDVKNGYGIQSTARAFGLGRPTGVGLPQEAAGRIPDLAFKKSVNKTNPDPFSRTWLPGDEANVATGQGDVLVTPLQMADAYAAFANGGTLYSPRLASRILTPGGAATVRNLPAENEGKVGLAPAVRAALLPGFVGAVSAGGGTATAAFRGYQGLPIAGKTGTAQQPPPTQDTAWFVGLVNPEPTAPNQPQYVVVVTVEQAGFGGTVAAPIARQIIEALSGNPNPGPVQLAKPQTD